MLDAQIEAILAEVQKPSRYIGGEVYDRWPLYRIPVGGARLTPDTEARYFYGPPLPNPQAARR